MKILLLGATGYSGKVVLEELLRRGHKVTAVTRDIQSLKTEKQSNPNLSILEGNVLDLNFIQTALQSQDAVINCLGIGGGNDGKITTLLSDSAKVLVLGMEKSTTKRLISMSNIGVGDSEKFNPWIFRAVILTYFMKWLKVIIDDKNRMEPVIMGSTLDWTIVRCPNIIDKPERGKVTATLDGKGLKLSITNPDVATFIADQLNSKTFLRKAPSISN